MIGMMEGTRPAEGKQVARLALYELIAKVI
jgi:hypothetical protein